MHSKRVLSIRYSIMVVSNSHEKTPMNEASLMANVTVASISALFAVKTLLSAYLLFLPYIRHLSVIGFVLSF